MSTNLISNLSLNNFDVQELNQNASVKEMTENLLKYCDDPKKDLAQSYVSYLGNLVSDIKRETSTNNTIRLIACSFRKNLPQFFKIYQSIDPTLKTQFLRNALKFFNQIGKNSKDKNISSTYFDCSLKCAKYGAASTDLNDNDKAFFHLKIAKYYTNKKKPFLAEQAANSGLKLNPSDASIQNSLKNILDFHKSDSVKRKAEDSSLSLEPTKKLHIDHQKKK